MSIFKDKNQKFSFKRLMIVVLFSMSVLQWIFGVVVSIINLINGGSIEAWLPTYTLALTGAGMGQYVWGKKVDNGG